MVEQEQIDQEAVEGAVVETTVDEVSAPEENKAEKQEAQPSPATDVLAEEEAGIDAKPKVDGSKWYIIHAYSGFEKKVAAAITEQAEKNDLNKYIEDIVVPTESVVEVKKGKKVETERKFFPGYVLAKMIINDETWHLVKNTPKVTGFIGGTINKPLPISDHEAEQIFAQIKEGKDTPRHKVTFLVGDAVKVIDGPFDSFVGSIEEIDDDREKLQVSVSIFGRPTPLELDYTQVEKA